MDALKKELESIVGMMRVKQNEPMSSHTTFKIGGPAKLYVEVQNLDEFPKVVIAANKHKIPVFILGGGSNIIVSDEGFDGLVIKNNCRKFDVMTMVGKVKNRASQDSTGSALSVDNALVYAESGVIMNQLVRFTIDQGLCGLEYQLGLPGTVGGGIYMNSNWPNKNAFVGDFVYKAKLLQADGIVKEVGKEYFKFAYDYSFLQDTNEVVLSVIFQLKPEEKKVLWDRGMEALNHRSSSQPKESSAGCTFRNISIAESLQIPTLEKITSAGYLIDKAGLKGKRIGNAMISGLHANFIVNLGGATANDVMQLVKLAKDEVYRMFQVHLRMEVKRVGFN